MCQDQKRLFSILDHWRSLKILVVAGINEKHVMQIENDYVPPISVVLAHVLISCRIDGYLIIKKR